MLAKNRNFGQTMLKFKQSLNKSKNNSRNSRRKEHHKITRAVMKIGRAIHWSGNHYNTTLRTYYMLKLKNIDSICRRCHFCLRLHRSRRDTKVTKKSRKGIPANAQGLWARGNLFGLSRLLTHNALKNLSSGIFNIVK